MKILFGSSPRATPRQQPVVVSARRLGVFALRGRRISREALVSPPGHLPNDTSVRPQLNADAGTEVALAGDCEHEDAGALSSRVAGRFDPQLRCSVAPLRDEVSRTLIVGDDQPGGAHLLAESIHPYLEVSDSGVKFIGSGFVPHRIVISTHWFVLLAKWPDRNGTDNAKVRFVQRISRTTTTYPHVALYQQTIPVQSCRSQRFRDATSRPHLDPLVRYRKIPADLVLLSDAEAPRERPTLVSRAVAPIASDRDDRALASRVAQRALSLALVDAGSVVTRCS